MGKLLLLGLLSVIALPLPPQGRETMQNPIYTITIDPSPLTAGKTATITYSGPVGTKLTLDWDPAAEPSSLVVGDKGEVTLTVPTNATSLIVSDPHGNTDAATVNR